MRERILVFLSAGGTCGMLCLALGSPVADRHGELILTKLGLVRDWSISHMEDADTAGSVAWRREGSGGINIYKYLISQTRQGRASSIPSGAQ